MLNPAHLTLSQHGRQAEILPTEARLYRVTPKGRGRDLIATRKTLQPAYIAERWIQTGHLPERGIWWAECARAGLLYGAFAGLVVLFWRIV